MVEEPSKKLILPIKEEGGRLFLTITPDIKSRYNLREIRSNMLELSVGNMRLDRIRATIEEASGRPQDIGPVFTYFEKEKERYIRVVVADDERWALIDVVNWDVAEITPDDIRFCLYKGGVTEGIKEDALAEAAAKKVANKEILVAESVPAINGEDARIEFLVSVTHKPKPRILPDGSVDLKSYDLLVGVRKDQALARKTPARPGVMGATVLGRPIPARQGSDVRLSGGKGCYISEDGLELRAASDGSALKDGKGNLYVEQTYHVRGDLDYSTGNIDCAGDVKIGGDVLSGFSLSATGDVVVHGVIEGARVISKNGSVMVKGGIHGKQNQAYIEAKETVAAKFIQEATIAAGDTVMVSGHVLDSVIRAGRNVDVSSARGSVLNSLVQAGEQIIVRNLGGAGSKGTEASISDADMSADEIRERIAKLEESIAALEEKLGKLKEVVGSLKTTGGPAVQMGMRIRSCVDSIKEENDRLATVMAKQAALKQVLAKLLRGRIIIIDTLYPGSRVCIAGLAETARDPVKSVVYCVEKGELTSKPYKTAVRDL